MSTENHLYQGISKCAWAYVFLYFDLNLGSVSILPDFVAFLFFLTAIELLSAEERELGLLRPLVKLLMGWHLLQWAASWFSTDLDGLIPGLDIIICLSNLYFHFQLLTNLSTIAGRHQSEGARYDEKLLRYRTMQTVLFTSAMFLTQLAPLMGEFWTYVSLGMTLIYLIAGVCVISALFGLRKEIGF